MPPPCVPNKAPRPPGPTLQLVLDSQTGPPEKLHRPEQTYFGNTALRQLSVPLVLNFLDETAFAVDVDVHLAANDLHLSDALDRVLVLEIQADWVAGRGHSVAEAFYGGEAHL